MRCIRLKNTKDLEALEKLNSIKGENILKNYPLHKRWIDKAIKEILSGNRIAFGVFQDEELIGSVIMKFGFSQELELKNFIIKSDDINNTINSELVRKKILEQVNRFCQKNRFEKCIIDIVTNDLNEINFFLKEGFKVVHLKESSYKSNQNTYSLSKQVDSIYNDDPLDFLKMVNWILEYKYNFKNIGSPVGVNFDDCSRIFDTISFSIDNNIPNKFKIKGEALIDCESLNQIPSGYYDELNSLYSSDSDIKLFFSQSMNSNLISLGIKEFSFSDILELMGKESNVLKVPFDSYETGGILFFVDERFENMINNYQSKLFKSASFVLYLVDGIGSSLEMGQIVLFCKYDIFSQRLTVWGHSTIEAKISDSYSKILADFRDDDTFIKNEIGDFYDPYSKEDWNYYTSYLQSVSSENLLRNDMTVLKLESITLLKKEREILPDLDKEVQDYVLDSLKELIVESIYIDKRSVNNININLNSPVPFNNQIPINMPPVTPKIFISYSHKDSDFTNNIKEIIENEGFQVRIDINDLNTGKDIIDFINDQIRDSDITLTVISKNSISSSWVAIETLTSIYSQNIIGHKLFPCVIEKDFYDSEFVDSMYDVLDEKIEALITKINNRNTKKRSTEDLDNEKNRLTNLRNNLAMIVDKLKNMGCVNFFDNFDSAKQKLINDLKNTSR